MPAHQPTTRPLGVANAAVLVSVAKTVADLFRYRRTVGDALTVEGLRPALRQHKARPAQIARKAVAGGVWRTVKTYLMALNVDLRTILKRLGCAATHTGAQPLWVIRAAELSCWPGAHMRPAADRYTALLHD